jgi:hypothetical protein
MQVRSSPSGATEKEFAQMAKQALADVPSMVTAAAKVTEQETNKLCWMQL